MARKRWNIPNTSNADAVGKRYSANMSTTGGGDHSTNRYNGRTVVSKPRGERYGSDIIGIDKALIARE